MTIRIFASALVVVALAFGCGPSPTAGTTGPKKEVHKADASTPADLFPLSVGNAWTYNLSVDQLQNGQVTATQTMERVFKVEKVDQTSNGTVGQIIIYDEEQKPVASFKILVNDKGLFQMTVGSPGNEIAYDAPLPWATWGTEVDKQVDHKTRGPLAGSREIGTIESATFYRGEREADAMTQRYASKSYDSTQKYIRDDGSGLVATQRSWFAPKVGLVRLVEAITNGQVTQRSTWVLKSHTVK